MFEYPTKYTNILERPKERDSLFLFLCEMQWRERHDLYAYQELVAALDDTNEDIRTLAEDLLHRSSPRHRNTQLSNKGWNDF